MRWLERPGAWWRRHRRARLAVWTCLALGAIGLLAVASVNAWVIYSAAPQIRPDAATVPHSQAAIIFGAAVYRDGRLSAVTYDRVQTGVDLYRAGRVEKLIISGDCGRTDYDEVNPMTAQALRAGIPPEDVFTDYAGFSTYDTVARAKRVFKVETAVLVTQRFHLPRALMIARSYGLSAVGAPADRRIYSERRRMAARECLARTKDFIKAILRPDPAFLGAEIPITADGRLTRDCKLALTSGRK